MLTSNLADLNNSSFGHQNHPILRSLSQSKPGNKLFDEAGREYFNQKRETNQLPASLKSDSVACQINSPHLILDYFNSQLIHTDVSGQTEPAESNSHVLDLMLASKRNATNSSHVDDTIDTTKLEYRKRNESSQYQKFDSMDLSYLTGRAHEKLGNFDEALMHFQKSLELNTALGDHVSVRTTLNRINSIHDKQEARSKM